MPDEMTPEEEHAFYARPENQEPQGVPRRRGPLSAPIPVRFTNEQLILIKQRAGADDRSVSAWVRRAVEHELARTA